MVFTYFPVKKYINKISHRLKTEKKISSVIEHKYLFGHTSRFPKSASSPVNEKLHLKRMNFLY